MITRRAFCASCITLPVALAGCGSQQPALDAPPALRLGRDVCVRCRMIISEERFASGIVAADGSARLFDDPGEMIATIAEEGGLGDARAWVHGSPSLEWMDATEAWYVKSETYPTPMGTGIVPFDSQQEAEAFAAERSGVVMSWAELVGATG